MDLYSNVAGIGAAADAASAKIVDLAISHSVQPEPPDVSVVVPIYREERAVDVAAAHRAVLEQIGTYRIFFYSPDGSASQTAAITAPGCPKRRLNTSIRMRGFRMISSRMISFVRSGDGS